MILNRLLPAYIIAFAIFAPTVVHAGLLLTGEIAAKNSEVYYAPRVSGWQIQIEWMLPEGQVAKPGELVVLFDRSNIDAEIESKQTDILKNKDQLALARSQGEEEVIDAEFALSKAKLEYEKAKIDAGVGVQYVSAYEHEKANVELQRKLLEVEKSERRLATKRKEVETDIQKKLTAIKKTEYELALLEKKSKLTALYSENGGPMVYGSHPWNGNKIAVGSSVQATWKVAEIAASDQMRVVAWLNEVDKASLALGDKVKVFIDALKDVELAGAVAHIESQSEEKEAWGTAAYFGVEIELDSVGDVKLVPGMSVLVEVLP